LIEILILDEIIDGIITSIISGVDDNKSFHFGKNQVNITSLVFFTDLLYDKCTVYLVVNLKGDKLSAIKM